MPQRKWRRKAPALPSHRRCVSACPLRMVGTRLSAPARRPSQSKQSGQTATRLLLEQEITFGKRSRMQSSRTRALQGVIMRNRKPSVLRLRTEGFSTVSEGGLELLPKATSRPLLSSENTPEGAMYPQVRRPISYIFGQYRPQPQRIEQSALPQSDRQLSPSNLLPLLSPMDPARCADRRCFERVGDRP